ncbi:MAG TPA: protein-tyrosine phosphatase family protein [Pseudomonadales bacterium]|nr:protein-tyrosine phosphatase family protein [Pseudomonadales bacterium]
MIRRFRRPRQRPPEMYWAEELAPLQLALMPRPRGGDQLAADVRHYADEGVVRILSLLEDAEISAFDLEAEADLCAEHGIAFQRFPIPDHGTPADMEAYLDFVDAQVPTLVGLAPVAVHCMAGIGRSSLTAAALLMRSGRPVGQVFPPLARARGCSVPETTEQVLWFRDFALRYAINR